MLAGQDKGGHEELKAVGARVLSLHGITRIHKFEITSPSNSLNHSHSARPQKSKKVGFVYIFGIICPL